MTAAAQGTRITALPAPHPDIHPADVAELLLAIGPHITVVIGDPAALGDCLACAPLQVGGPDPAVGVLCHREVDDERSWLHSWPLCGAHLVREIRPVLAKRTPAWVDVPRVVLEP